ncbi:high affinity choline transporter 1-like [Prorops nasuta]|uniref:high affinity choline transporter 1-like n=1 Tax=Prorops nasuta TaxID=863751 RepID=UPI0034CE327F
MYVAGLIGVAVFYILILVVGIWAGAAKSKRSNDMFLANRDIGFFLGAFTLIATWVGGAFVNGTAEVMFTKGLAWCQVPIGYSLSLFFGALLFVRPMRNAEYITMLDPFQEKYGSSIGGLLFLPALCGDLFWCGSVLRALGSSLSVVGHLDPNISVCASALLVGIYTVFGGLYSVACTDALQLICIGLGLAVAAPFAMLNPAVDFRANLATKDWLGEIHSEDYGIWIDGMLLIVFGGIPWQGYFQRILSIRSARIAVILSGISTIGCLILAIPSAVIGVVARATDWSLLIGDHTNVTLEDGNATLPLVLGYLTPSWVAFIGLGAISAAVMSSADSSMLASSSMFSRNVYKLSLRPKASEKELNWILRISVVVIAILSTTIALTVNSVYYLSYISSDLVYVVLFPQLLAVIYWPSYVDTYGCIASYVVAIVLRIAGGEKNLGLPALIEYPFFDHVTQTQRFPFRTAIMILAIFTHLVVSYFSRNLFGKGYCPEYCDVLNVYSPGKQKDQPTVAQSHSGVALVDSSSKSNSCVDSCDSSYNMAEDRQMISQEIGEMTILGKQNSVSIQQTPHSLSSTPRNKLQLRTPCRSDVGEILAVRNLPRSLNTQGNIPKTPVTPMTPLTPMTPKIPITVPPLTPSAVPITPTTLTFGTPYTTRTKLEFNLHPQEFGNVPYTGLSQKKNVKGVKLVGMDGTSTLRRPSTQGTTFSSTSSVELVNILDRRQSGGSYGPGSLSPVPIGVEACKTHGTASEGQAGNEHCKIKRGIVRHHSFNDTGDRTLTTLARQPAYPSMPLRPEDCRMSLIRRDRRSPMLRHSSVLSEKEYGVLDTNANPATLGYRGLISPSYSMYNSKSSSYFAPDDEAISRF